MCDSGTNPVDGQPAVQPEVLDEPAAQDPVEQVSDLVDEAETAVGEYGDHVDSINDDDDLVNFYLPSLIGPLAEGDEQAIVDAINVIRPGFKDTLNERHDAKVAAGENLLNALSDAGGAGLEKTELEDILDQVLSPETEEGADSPAAVVAIATTLSDPDAEISAETLDGVMAFLDRARHDGTPGQQYDELAAIVAQKRLDLVSERLPGGDGYTSHADAQEAVNELARSSFAGMLGMDEAQFNTALTGLSSALQPGQSLDDLTAALESLNSSVESLDNQGVAEGLRLLGLQGGTNSLSEAGRIDLDRNDAATALVNAAGVGQGIAGHLLDAGTPAARMNNLLGIKLGVFSVALLPLSIGDLANDISDGDITGALINGVGIASTVAGTAAALYSSASWAGPVGIAAATIGMVAFIGGMQWDRVQASNEFMQGEKREQGIAILEHFGFSPGAAEALTDQSSQGVSPVPFLMAYGESRGLTPEQTIEWLNGLDSGDLAQIRDFAHHSLDRVNGDHTRLQGTEVREGYGDTPEFTGAGVGVNQVTPQEQRQSYENMFGKGQNAAQNMAEFTRLLEVKGLVTPAPPLDAPGVEPMDLPRSADILLEKFDSVTDGDEYITDDHLRRVRDDDSASPELRMAAEFVLGSKAARSYLDVGQGEGSVDGNISRGDLEAAIEKLASGDYLDDLLDTASGRGGRDGNISDNDLASALVDPGLTPEQRQDVEQRLGA